MPDYSKSKVYNIVCNITGETYYGSTVQKISQRMNGHRKKDNECLSKQITERGDYHYGLVEDYKCDNLEQLLMRERYYVDNNDCINKRSPIRTKEEKIAYYEEHKEEHAAKNKVYYHNNKDKVKAYLEKNKNKISEQRKGFYERVDKERKKVFYEANKDKIIEQKKVFYEANKDKILEQKKVFYEANKDKISEHRKQRVVCECGCELSKGSLTGHRKTKFHQEFIQSLASGGNTI